MREGTRRSHGNGAAIRVKRLLAAAECLQSITTGQHRSREILAQAQRLVQQLERAIRLPLLEQHQGSGMQHAGIGRLPAKGVVEHPPGLLDPSVHG